MDSLSPLFYLIIIGCVLIALWELRQKRDWSKDKARIYPKYSRFYRPVHYPRSSARVLTSTKAVPKARGEVPKSTGTVPLYHFAAYPIGQEPKIEPKAYEEIKQAVNSVIPGPNVEYIRTRSSSNRSTRSSSNRKKTRQKQDIESIVKRQFTKYNQDIDPEGIDFSMLVDHNLSARENIAQFKKADNPMSIFKWD